MTTKSTNRYDLNKAYSKKVRQEDFPKRSQSNKKVRNKKLKNLNNIDPNLLDDDFLDEY